LGNKTIGVYLLLKCFGGNFRARTYVLCFHVLLHNSSRSENWVMSVFENEKWVISILGNKTLGCICCWRISGARETLHSVFTRDLYIGIAFFFKLWSASSRCGDRPLFPLDHIALSILVWVLNWFRAVRWILTFVVGKNLRVRV
jgi:hypothetical protein